MSNPRSIPTADERVLATLNKDGSRRWLRPRLSPGRFLNGRKIVGYALIVLFAALPYIRINGKPAMLLDLPNREFTFFGRTFLPTDTLLLAFMLLTIFVTIFLLTALFGRVWCGWGCPQTVYMELVYRPVERLFEGKTYKSGGRVPLSPARAAGKYLTFLAISMFLAHVFLAYFVGIETLAHWVRQSPLTHPAAFLVMAGTTTLMMIDFCFFREQMCTLACPYGRFQSVLLDRQSLIIGYDTQRGEPRGKLKKDAPDDSGDCIDCKACVVTCPTGIDIRDGLQLECIGCAQCIDACDEIMDKIQKPRGLIRYSSQEAMEKGRSRLLRPRVVIYPLVLVVLVSLFSLTLAKKGSADVSFLRHRGQPYQVLESGAISSTLLVKIVNRSDDARTYGISVDGVVEQQSGDLPLELDSGASGQVTLHLTVDADRFSEGRADIVVRVDDGTDFDRDFEHHLMGPLYSTNDNGAAPRGDAQ